MRSNTQTQKLYSRRASLYERLFVGFLGWGRELDNFFRGTDYVHPGSKILDAGCGTGIVTRILYQHALEKRYEGVGFHAFDLTPSMLELFQNWVENQGATNIELRKADVLDIELLPSDWKDHDLIVTSTMLEYLPKPEILRAVMNLKRLLRNGGLMLVFITNKNVITRWLAARWWKTNLYQKGEIQTLLQEAGFQQIEYRQLSRWWSNSITVIEAKK